ncbi:1-acyl-sn-glycerol-3-phosphate acyltransferase [uncultured Brevundimonas sp.]|uniref:GNAT family N-acetyltransferase n=1 Tax=uncultured Brevundimonas sp. TaxID=213418 RepID=UPI0026154699|nr:1-acyl-sn-glycerol-3-phosphate acyltransferase [uncultured Brevundimonas sp.]
MASSPLHIVDVLIAERAPRLTRSVFWPVVRPALYGVLGYPKAVAMADAVRDLSGADAFQYVSDLLKLKVETTGLENLPAKGRCVIVCNHPTGIADGVAMYDAVRQVRDDAIFFANADALRVAPRLDETIIPVEWVHAKRTREKTRHTLNAAKQAFAEERCIVMFPAGRLARAENGVLTDPPWESSAASLARKYNAPVVPVRMTGPTSKLFHTFDRFSEELRDVTLFHELLNKEGRTFGLTFAKPVSPDQLPVDADAATDQLKTYIERHLAARPDAPFPE